MDCRGIPRGYLGDHQQPYEEADAADKRDEDLSAIAAAQHAREEVDERRNEALDAHELRVQPHQDDHEEEEYGPERRHRHLRDRLRTGNKFLGHSVNAISIFRNAVSDSGSPYVSAHARGCFG